MPRFKTEAIVLKKKHLLNRDMTVTFFSREKGKLTLVAKGVKKISSRRLPHIQTGNLLSLEVEFRRERFSLITTQLISGFMGLKTDATKHAYMYLMFFLLDRLLPELEPEPKVFQLVVKFLVKLANTENFSKMNMEHYLIALMDNLGYGVVPASYEELIERIESIIHEKIQSNTYSI